MYIERVWCRLHISETDHLYDLGKLDSSGTLTTFLRILLLLNYQPHMCIILMYQFVLILMCDKCICLQWVEQVWPYYCQLYSYAPVIAIAKRLLRVNFWSVNDRMDVLLVPFLNGLPSSEVNVQFFLVDLVVVINANLFWMFSIEDDDDESDDDGLLRLRSAYRIVRFDDGECALSSYSCSILANLKSSFSCFSCCRIFSRKLPFFGTVTAVVDGFVRFDAVHSSITFSCCCNFVPRFLLLVLLLLLLLILLQVIGVFDALLQSSSKTTSICLRCALLRPKFIGALPFVSVLLPDAFIGWNMQNADRRWTDVNFCLSLLRKVNVMIVRNIGLSSTLWQNLPFCGFIYFRLSFRSFLFQR